METHYFSSLNLTSSVLVIGAFDGVHKGHQQLIKSAYEEAKRLHIPLVAYTFSKPPRVYFQNVMQLISLDEKLARLERLGVDHAIIAQFDTHYAARSKEQFIVEIEQLNPFQIWVGEDFRFGAKRQGDINYLRQFFHVKNLAPVYCENGTRISSTRIRNLLLENSQLQADELLGWKNVKAKQLV